MIPQASNRITPYGSTNTNISSVFDYRLNQVHTCCCGVIKNQCGDTTRNQKCQICKMLSIVITPVVILLGLTCFFLVSTGSVLISLSMQEQAVLDSQRIVRLIHVMQNERDQTLLYLSSIGPDTKTYLLQRYQATDKAMEHVIRWPEDANILDNIVTKRDFVMELQRHRDQLETAETSGTEEIRFYTALLEILMKGMYRSVTKSKFGGIWKSMMAHQNLVTSKEDFGIKRALGTSYFAGGGFKSHDDYLLYLRKTNVYRYDYYTAQSYSPDIISLEDYLRETFGSDILYNNVIYYDAYISQRNITNKMLEVAVRYYDNMTTIMELLYELQLIIAGNIQAKLRTKVHESSRDLIAGSLIMILVILSLPVQIVMVIKQTASIQVYSNILASRTSELDKERRKADSLLYTMLPKEIAKQLRNKSSVRGEYFDEVTVFFSEIDDFLNITKTHTALHVVGLLQEMYVLFDSRMNLYDVYKVENIVDQNMIASGVPRRNGNEHATAVADLAVDICNCFRTMDSQNIPGFRVKIRIGIHSGPVMAGVVGLKLPKYSLFGDTVNTAARMESNGKANRIHISETTHRILKGSNKFVFVCRGGIHIKGKGLMLTYWLDDVNTPYASCSKSLASVELNEVVDEQPAFLKKLSQDHILEHPPGASANKKKSLNSILEDPPGSTSSKKASLEQMFAASSSQNGSHGNLVAEENRNSHNNLLLHASESSISKEKLYDHDFSIHMSKPLNSKDIQNGGNSSDYEKSSPTKMTMNYHHKNNKVMADAISSQFMRQASNSPQQQRSLSPNRSNSVNIKHDECKLTTTEVQKMVATSVENARKCRTSSF